jgi:hypothetical protein
MRAVTRRGHADQTRNAGRLPYWVHTDAVADICRQALALTGELPADAAEDLVLAAYGHDLYEDTDISSQSIRQEFGSRVDDWISGMTNRQDDHNRADYLRDLAAADDEVRVIKCADLIDNMLSVAYGLHDLGLDWVNDFFLPIAGETRAMLVATTFDRLPRTGGYLIALVQWAWTRLAGNIETVADIAADVAATPTTTTGDLMTNEEPLSPEEQKMIEAMTFTPEEWAESKAKHEAKQEAKAKELFGDGPRFAIPDTDTDA